MNKTFRDKAWRQAAANICSFVQKGLTVTRRCLTTEKETSKYSKIQILNVVVMEDQPDSEKCILYATWLSLL